MQAQSRAQASKDMLSRDVQAWCNHRLSSAPGNLVLMVAH